MSISKIDSNTKTNCGIIAGSLAAASGLSITSLALNDVMPKDIFQYKNLPVGKKKIIKHTGLAGIITAVLLALYSLYPKVNSNKNSK